MFLNKLAFFIVCIGPFFFLECLASNPPYFQQDLSYAINVTLNDTLHELTGEETIVYKNNSNQPISYIYFHLWPNAFKNNQTLFAQQQVTNKNLAFYFSNDSDKGYIDQLSFTINSRPAIFQYNADTIDIGKLLLNEPLLPGQQITIHTPFQVKIPNSCSRLGHSQQQYQISQWYPKPAVFDNTGWHPLPYFDQGEFYAEFATYDVTITIPANYRVAATGDLQTASEQAWLQTLADSTQRIQNYSKDNSFPISSKSTKTISYHAEKVHDFAWFADKRYHVLKGKATLNDTTKTVDTYLFYTNKGAKYWKKGIPIINKTISAFSKWIGDYPYHQVAAVEGELKAGGGMEYPMVTVIGDVFSESTLETVIVHEVGHNWFQGILGSNERLYPWLDEGINSYYEKRLTDAPVKRTTKKKSSLGKFNKLITSGFAVNSFMEEGNSIEYLAYLLNARKMEDQATGSAAADFFSINYYADVYAKTPLLFNYLVAVIGQDSFDVYMQRYYKKWQFKHPAPSDIKAIFASSPFYLDWFFEEAIATNKKFDLQLKKIARATQKIGNSNYFKVTVVNKSNIRTPYTISAWTNDSIIATIPYGGFLGEMDVLFPKGKYTKLQIDALYQIPEINRKNNSSKITGIFRKANPLKVIPFFDIENPNKSELYYAPVAAWNAYDGLMLGLLLYNNTATLKRFSFEVMPFYGTTSKQITGLANVSYDWYPKTVFQNIHLKLGVKSFTENKIESDYFAFMRFKPQLDFNLKKSNLRTSSSKTISLASTIISYNGLLNNHSNNNLIDLYNSTWIVNSIQYKQVGTDNLQPASFLARLEADGFSNCKLIVEMRHKWILTAKNKGFSWNLFAGTAFGTGFYSTLSSYTGLDDYLYDQYFFTRNKNTGWLANQITIRDGAFKIITPLAAAPIGRSNQLVITNNFYYDLPIKLPIRAYAGIGYIQKKSSFFAPFQYEGGLAFHLGDIFQVNFPFFLSNDFNTYFKENYGNLSALDRYSKKITFSLSFHSLNPFDWIRDFKLN